MTWTYVHPDFSYTLTGTYTVNGKNIDFEIGDDLELQTFTGTFDGKDEMSGDGVYLIYGDASPQVLNNRMRRQARAVADSETWNFTWIGTR